MSLQSLKHLAQEHLAAMHLVIAAREATPENEADLPRLAQKVRDAFAKQMEPHFQDEEKSVLPKLRKIGHDNLADRTLAEHEHMRKLIAQMEQPTIQLLHEFSDTLRAHILFENNTVWQALEGRITTNGSDGLKT